MVLVCVGPGGKYATHDPKFILLTITIWMEELGFSLGDSLLIPISLGWWKEVQEQRRRDSRLYRREKECEI